MRMQHPCALSSEQCSRALQSLTEEEWELVRGRCAIDERVTYDAAVICKRHADEWLHWYKPTRCAACPNPLSSSAWRPCPEWMREQLGAQQGAFVHERPCYKAAVAAKKQLAADTQPMEVEQGNIFPSQSVHSSQPAMRRHRSVRACIPTLTCSSALLGCNSSAQATPPSLLVAAVNWISALFITFRLLLLPVAAAPGCPLFGYNHEP